jgi:hypothetical protein
MRTKLVPESKDFPIGALASSESRFEQPDTGPFCSNGVRAYFGRKLQRLYPLPPDSSEPANVRKLLRRIEAELEKPPVPGNG